jgi:hypothetical protein
MWQMNADASAIHGEYQSQLCGDGRERLAVECLDGFMWRDIAWRGMAWHGMEWSGMEWKVDGACVE